MSYDDFCRVTFEELEAIIRAWREMTEGHVRDAWERTRVEAAIGIQPHVKKRITPRQLIPLPWDSNKDPEAEAPKLSPDERRQRFEQVVNHLKS